MSTCILLATYNGARYLPELLDSLEGQTITNWQLLVRDDSSTDGTLEILEKSASADGRIRVLHDARGRLGAARNFGVLMESALALDCEYFAFADQDDVWIPEKIGRQLERMRGVEAGGRDVPLLVHSDLMVVDERLSTRYPSFMRWSSLPVGDRVSPNNLLVRNSVVGCTMLANRRLLELAVPAPAEMVMHDWWLGLLAASCGHLVYDDIPTVLYRQHADNEIGATSLGQKLRAGWRNWRPVWGRALANFRNGIFQARALRDRLRQRHEKQASPMLPLVEDYCRLFDGTHGRPSRLWHMHRLGIRLPGRLRQATLLARAFALSSPMANHSRTANCPRRTCDSQVVGGIP
jgi:rhamnosyltransferase